MRIYGWQFIIKPCNKGNVYSLFRLPNLNKLNNTFDSFCQEFGDRGPVAPSLDPRLPICATALNSCYSYWLPICRKFLNLSHSRRLTIGSLKAYLKPIRVGSLLCIREHTFKLTLMGENCSFATSDKIVISVFFTCRRKAAAIWWRDVKHTAANTSSLW